MLPPGRTRSRATASSSRCKSGSGVACHRWSGRERVRPGGSITYAVCTIAEAENAAVADEVGLPFDDLGAQWPGFRHPTRPEFLLTLPHVHRTSGFFVARMRA